jgi:hypothetical protein
MNGLPFPTSDGVPYYNNPDAVGNLAMPVEQYIRNASNIFVPVSATNPEPTADAAVLAKLVEILAKIIAAPATEAKQDTIIGYVDGVESTLATLLTKSGFDAKADITLSALRDAIRGASNKTLTDLATALAPLSTAAKQDALLAKDFATQTTLAAILEKIIAAPATEAKQTALNALIGEAQAAPTANTLLARLKSLEDKIDKITSGTTPAVTTLSGSDMELYGASLDDRPDATTVPIGATFTIVDASQDFKTWMSNGVDWGEEI